MPNKYKSEIVNVFYVNNDSDVNSDIDVED